VLAAAVPPYLHKSGDNPDGGLDDATIAQFEDGSGATAGVHRRLHGTRCAGFHL
jgi:hypothetical protein